MFNSFFVGDWGAYIPYWLSLLMSMSVSKLLEWILSKPWLLRVVALKIHLVYLSQEGSCEQVILDVRLVLGLFELLIHCTLYSYSITFVFCNHSIYTEMWFSKLTLPEKNGCMLTWGQIPLCLKVFKYFWKVIVSDLYRNEKYLYLNTFVNYFTFSNSFKYFFKYIFNINISVSWSHHS